MTYPLKKIRRRNANGEATIQAGIIDWIRLVSPQVRAFAVPNGGLRSKSEAARLKWQGVLAGVPDICVVIPGGTVAFLEVKTGSGTASPAQKEIMAWLSEAAVPCRIVRSIDDTRTAFADWGIFTREA